MIFLLQKLGKVRQLSLHFQKVEGSLFDEVAGVILIGIQIGVKFCGMLLFYGLGFVKFFKRLIITSCQYALQGRETTHANGLAEHIR